MAHDGSSHLYELDPFSDSTDDDSGAITKSGSSSGSLVKGPNSDEIAFGSPAGAPGGGPGAAEGGSGLQSGVDTSYLSEMAATRSLSSGTASWVVPHEISIQSQYGAAAGEGFGAPANGGPPGAPGAAASMTTLANYLTSGFWADRGASGRYFDMSSGFNNGVLYYNVTGWTGNLPTFYGNEADSNGISAARADMVRAAFAVYSAVLGIQFIETTSTATHVDFFFKDSASGVAYEAEQLYSGSGGRMDYAIINVSAGWSGGSSNIGGTNGYTFQTFLHEIGHALGLGHQGLYNAGSGSPTYANSAIWANDSWTQTMMSYWDQGENTEYSTDSYAQLVSPMAVDWIALNTLYAGQGYGTSNAFTGNTIWGVGTNITTAGYNGLATYAATNAFTIVDGGGIDTIDFSNYSANQTINLTPSSASSTRATLSSVGGLVNNMTLAVGTVIENATTGGGNDTIYGNSTGNVLTGNAGSDYLTGYGGNDTLYAGSGTDTMYGGDGNDYLFAGGLFTSGDFAYGGAGNDYIQSGLGTETMDGGADIDIIDHRQFSGDYVFNMVTGLTNFGGESFTNFESAWMGDGNDSVTGTTGDNTIYGGGGNDTINDGAGGDLVYGGEGDDLFLAGDSSFTGDSWNGGNGTDTLSYEAYNWGAPGSPVVFNFLTGIASYNGFTETFSSIEIFRGSQGTETIISNGGGQTYYGLGGDDSMLSGLGGETMYGGDGTDVIDHRAFNGTYVFDMSTGLTNFGNELFLEYEIAYMGNGNDSLTGTAGDNTLYGGLGNDTINDGAGGDAVYGGDGNDVLMAGDSSFSGDSWYGGIGTDTLSYENFNWGAPFAPVVFNFVTGIASYNGFTETFDSIEIFRGSQGTETIISNGGGQTYYGLGGDDSMLSGLGGETMYGGDGTDVIDHRAYNGNYVFDMSTGLTNFGNELYLEYEIAYMGNGNDALTGTGGDNTLYGGMGNDTINDGAGGDAVYGGDGNDVLLAGDSSFTGDSWFGGDGTDTLSYEAYNWGTPPSEVVFNFVTGVASYNGFTETFDSIEIFRGSQGDETIISNGGGLTFYGNDGNDSMVSGLGSETMYGGNGIDVIDHRVFTGDYAIDMGTGLTNFGGELFQGFEIAYLGKGNDTVTGSFNSDTVYGGKGNDVFYGGGGADALYGDAGNDYFLYVTGAGYDNIYGGAGIDEAVYQAFFGDALTIDMTAGTFNGGGVNFAFTGIEKVTTSTGNDNVTGGSEANRITLNEGNDTARGLGANDSIFGGAGNDSLTGDAGDDDLRGGNDNDTLDGGAANDLLYGDDGNDSLLGGNGNDSMYGGNGDDTMLAGAGDDLIVGGNGNDTMTGNNGADTFVFKGAFGVDVITDFVIAGLTDRIDLSGVGPITDFTDLVTNHLSQSGANAVITTGVNSITLIGILATNLLADDFVF
jgi:Ca2+-binding RTX toxin-like protein